MSNFRHDTIHWYPLLFLQWFSIFMQRGSYFSVLVTYLVISCLCSANCELTNLKTGEMTICWYIVVDECPRLVQKDVHQPFVTHCAPTRMVRDANKGVFDLLICWSLFFYIMMMLEKIILCFTSQYSRMFNCALKILRFHFRLNIYVCICMFPARDSLLNYLLWQPNIFTCQHPNWEMKNGLVVDENNILPHFSSVISCWVLFFILKTIAVWLMWLMR